MTYVRLLEEKISLPSSAVNDQVPATQPEAETTLTVNNPLPALIPAYLQVLNKNCWQMVVSYLAENEATNENAALVDYEFLLLDYQFARWILADEQLTKLFFALRLAERKAEAKAKQVEGIKDTIKLLNDLTEEKVRVVNAIEDKKLCYKKKCAQPPLCALSALPGASMLGYGIKYLFDDVFGYEFLLIGGICALPIGIIVACLLMNQPHTSENELRKKPLQTILPVDLKDNPIGQKDVKDAPAQIAVQIRDPYAGLEQAIITQTGKSRKELEQLSTADILAILNAKLESLEVWLKEEGSRSPTEAALNQRKILLSKLFNPTPVKESGDGKNSTKQNEECTEALQKSAGIKGLGSR